MGGAVPYFMVRWQGRSRVRGRQRGGRRRVEVQTVHAEDAEVRIVFPGGVAVEVALAGKSIDLRATVREQPALMRTDVEARPQVTVDIVETRGPEE